MYVHSSYHCNLRRVRTQTSSSSCLRVSPLHYSSNILMLFTMRLLVALALCLCFVAPSPVLSFTMPEEKFVENNMADVGEEGTGQNDINSIAKSLIREVFGAEEREMIDEEAAKDAEEMSLSKRTTGSNRPQREIRARAQYPLGRRPPVTTRSKFTFGKRSSPPVISRPLAEQLLEELQRNAEMSDAWRNTDKMAQLNDADLYDTLQDNHQVQKDGYSAFSFGKRGMSAFSFGKRARPMFSFGKRDIRPSFAFGKRHGGSAFVFGRRDWAPTEQDFAADEESGPYQIKRAGDLAFAFGKREDQ